MRGWRQGLPQGLAMTLSHTNPPPDTPTCWREAPRLGLGLLAPGWDTRGQGSSTREKT